MAYDERLHLYIKLPKKLGGCWWWYGSWNGNGYGIVYFRKGEKKKMAHREIYQKFYNTIIPDDMVACHKCDNPSCVNPEHIFIGTQKDNMQDCSRKGRGVGKHGRRISNV